MKKGQYVIVRTYSAGCFAGTLQTRKGQEVTLTNARRLWHWAGAASLSELALRGTSNPDACKFPAPVSEILLFQAIEVLAVSRIAKANLEAVPEWSQ